MDFSPIPLSTDHVVNLLHYICPPSNLKPVPAHLLSLPLLQRHHFLSITTDNPIDYLTWPTDRSHSVLSLLESINPDILPLDPLSIYPDIHYAADPEALYAHIRITPTTILPSSHPDTVSSLRIIFLWDQSSSSWRYHNSATGPFPKHSHSDLSHAMALFQSPDDFLPERTYTFTVDGPDADDDAYWNAYSAVGDNHLSSAPIKPVIATDSEDAYWAQYSSIQGSADSTVPSPRPQGRKLQPQNTEADQRVFVPSSQLNPDHAAQEIYNPLVPPSPSSLSRRLAALPSRPDSPPLQEEDDPSSASASAMSPSPLSPPADLAEEPLVVSEPSPNAAAVIINPVENTTADEALKSTIRGLYHLWRSSSKSQQDFLVLVQQAIEGQP